MRAILASLIVCAGVLIGGALLGCRSQQAVSPQPPVLSQAPTTVAPAAPDISAVRAAFDAPGQATDIKSAWFDRQGRVMSALSEDPRRCDAALAYLQGEPQEDSNNFVGTLRCALFNVLAGRGDDERLRNYLSSIPLEVNDPDGFFIEFAILDPFADNPRMTGLYVLFDAYERASNPQARANLVRAVRRAFYHSIRPSMTDEEVMQFCPGEVRGHINGFKPNAAYAYAYDTGLFEVGNVVPPPLLIPRNGPDEVKAIILPSGQHHPPDWK